jgi:transposase InsO family protein
MQLWQVDIVGGVMILDPVSGVLREAKVVTGVNDHSRFCVIASVVERATARAVCLALAAALARFGVPEEILTDNGKQFTDRFNRYGASRGRCCSTRSAARTASRTGSPNRHRRTRTGRSSGSTAPSAPSSSTTPIRSSLLRRRRPRWMGG